MKDLLYSIIKSGATSQILLDSGSETVCRTELLLRVEGLARRLQELNLHSVALFVDNGIDWIVTDLACQVIGIRIVPLPLFFSADQIRHTIFSSGVDCLITDQDHLPEIFGETLGDSPELPLADGIRLHLLKTDRSAAIPDNTQKITFTSGTTGAPKGVCLSADQQLTVATSIAAMTGVDQPRHLCILPLSTLLENLAGVYAPLLAGGTVIVPPLADVGLAGSSTLDIKKLLSCISTHQPNTLILVPELLNAITEAAECGWCPPSPLHFVAVGGGKVSAELLRRARAVGVPAYEGYGLSECASVVTLNVANADHVGSVGRPLPHVDIEVVDDEIVVAGGSFLGYLGQPDTWNSGPVHTGDLGNIDDDGFVFISGRAKNQLITSFGRNVSPEWVESELTAGPLLQQTIVIGDARPYCVALVYPRQTTTTDEQISAWVRTTNQRLPDYARVVDWRRLSAPLTAGGLNRFAVESQYHTSIEHMYAGGKEASNQ